MKRAPRYTLIDAFERSLSHPDTFNFPGFDIVEQAKPGNLLKIGAEFQDADSEWSGERFWVIVRTVEGAGAAVRLTGGIDNELQCTDSHGLRLGDTVTFAPRHVLDYDFDA
ncbi:hypothetical protein RB623_27940 [Mesorhizobium sp. LHD-90]|uniref:hypothetical protein n=1 Tax=Mesorhizobium sp. LHD-90 TaxID=3071414 RepID=UPI0027E05DE0|nr:hypothetical protein [Mesorhizobium sp. LHD-90]MDQ6437904.1 hypothetical protein [Mesorhizobium sp. LHD-90]